MSKMINVLYFTTLVLEWFFSSSVEVFSTFRFQNVKCDINNKTGNYVMKFVCAIFINSICTSPVVE